jgi:NADPH-dependent 2,4-dienoyl-CoA reductase/sulfur reductase-like enzyme
VTDPFAMDRQFRRGRALTESLDGVDVDVRLRTSVVAVEGMTSVLVTGGKPASTMMTRRITVSAGAYDRPVAFPGWTLPGVITADELQTLAKIQRVLPGRRRVSADSISVALAFPAQLADYGVAIVEALEAGRALRRRVPAGGARHACPVDAERRIAPAPNGASTWMCSASPSFTSTGSCRLSPVSTPSKAPGKPCWQIP